MAIVGGVWFSFTIFYVEIMKEFGWSRAETAGIFSLNIVVWGLTAPVAGYLVDRFGPRRIMPAAAIVLALATGANSMATSIWHFYLLIGVVMGVATCMLEFVPLVAVIANWFVARRGLALGIAFAGFGASGISAVLTQYLIELVGWREGYIVLGVIIAVTVAPLTGIFLRARPQDMGLLPDGATQSSSDGESAHTGSTAIVLDREWASVDWTLRRALRTRRFWLLLISNFLIWGIGYNVLFTHQVVFFVDVGFTQMFAASIVGMLGAAGAIGNLGGFVSDRLGRETTFAFACGGCALGIIILLNISDPNQAWMPYLYAIIFGVSIGLAGPPLTAAVADLFEGPSFGTINGAITMGFGLGGSIGPWLGGYIFDSTGSYFYAFIIAAMGVASAGVCLWIAAPRKVRDPARKKTDVVQGKTNL